MKRTISPEEIKGLVSYDAETGLFLWLARQPSQFVEGERSASHQCNAWNSRHAGGPAFTSQTNGYLATRIWSAHVYAHRAAWAISYGAWPEIIDHKNGDRQDNRLCNLRSCDLSGNARNAVGKGGLSPFKGVSIDRRSGSWIANIRADGSTRYLGAFRSQEAAARAYDRAALRFHGDFARLNFPEGADA